MQKLLTHIIDIEAAPNSQPVDVLLPNILPQPDKNNKHKVALDRDNLHRFDAIGCVKLFTDDVSNYMDATITYKDDKNTYADTFVTKPLLAFLDLYQNQTNQLRIGGFINKYRGIKLHVPNGGKFKVVIEPFTGKQVPNYLPWHQYCVKVKNLSPINQYDIDLFNPTQPAGSHLQVSFPLGNTNFDRNTISHVRVFSKNAGQALGIMSALPDRTRKDNTGFVLIPLHDPYQNQSGIIQAMVPPGIQKNCITKIYANTEVLYYFFGQEKPPVIENEPVQVNKPTRDIPSTEYKKAVKNVSKALKNMGATKEGYLSSKTPFSKAEEKDILKNLPTKKQQRFYLFNDFVRVQVNEGTFTKKAAIDYMKLNSFPAAEIKAYLKKKVKLPRSMSRLKNSTTKK